MKYVFQRGFKLYNTLNKYSSLIHYVLQSTSAKPTAFILDLLHFFFYPGMLCVNP